MISLFLSKKAFSIKLSGWRRQTLYLCSSCSNVPHYLCSKCKESELCREEKQEHQINAMTSPPAVSAVLQAMLV